MAEAIQGEVLAENVHASYGFTRTMDYTREEHVQQVVRQANEELRCLLQRRAELVKRIGTLKQTIAGLANLFGPDVLSAELQELVTGRKPGGTHRGFTRTCRMVLMENKRPMSAREVCDQIREKDPVMLSRHRDPGASVTTVLNRLAEYGEAQAVTLPTGRRAWQWVREEG